MVPKSVSGSSEITAGRPSRFDQPSYSMENPGEGRSVGFRLWGHPEKKIEKNLDSRSGARRKSEGPN